MKLTKKASVLAILVSIVTTSAFAAWYPSQHQERSYFLDAAKTQPAGHSIQWCSGRYSTYGKITSHYNIEENFKCRGDGLN